MEIGFVTSISSAEPFHVFLPTKLIDGFYFSLKYSSATQKTAK